MKKPFKHTDRDLSVTCKYKGCKTAIKKNVLAKKEKADFCYKHWHELEHARRNNHDQTN